MSVEVSSPSDLNEDLNLNYRVSDQPVRTCHDEYLISIIDEINIRASLLGLDPRTVIREFESRSRNVGYIHMNDLYEAFRRLGIRISQSDYSMIVRRYRVNGMFLQTQSLVEDLENSMFRLKESHHLSTHPLLVANEISRGEMKVPFSKIKRADEILVYPKEFFRSQDTTHPSLDKWPNKEHLYDIMTRIQKHCFTKQIKPEQFFEGFDKSNCGKILRGQFICGLDMMGASLTGSHTRLQVTPEEVEEIVNLYTSKKVPEFVHWKKFVDDLSDVYAPIQVCNTPTVEMEGYGPTPNVKELQGKFAGNINFTKQEMLQLESAISWIKDRLRDCKAQFLPFFKSFDQYNHGFVTAVQFRQVMSMVNVPLTEDQAWILIKFFSEKEGFNYVKFVPVAGQDDSLRRWGQPWADISKVPLKASKAEAKVKVFDPVLESEARTVEGVLIKVRHAIHERHLRIGYYLEQFDRLKRHHLGRLTFLKAMESAHNFPLSQREYNILMDAFCDPFNKDIVYYKHFLRIVNEMEYLEGLEKSPLLVPLPYVPNLSVRRTPYTKAETNMLESMWIKIGKKCSMADWEIFMDVKLIPKVANTGTLDRTNLLRALDRLKLREILTPAEHDLLIEAFSVIHGREVRFDWHAFIRSADMVARKLNKAY